MSDSESGDEKFEALRKKAKEKLGDEITEIQTRRMSADDMHRIIEELRIHQVELEMQNEQLSRTQEELEASQRKYSNLYEFAPVGYLTPDREGKILEANLTATDMIGVPRGKLTKTYLYSHFVPEDRDILFMHLRKLSKEGGSQSCEARLFHKSSPVYLRLDTVGGEGNGKKVIRTTMTDITERKIMESALFRSESRLKLFIVGEADRNPGKRAGTHRTTVLPNCWRQPSSSFIPDTHYLTTINTVSTPLIAFLKYARFK